MPPDSGCMARMLHVLHSPVKSRLSARASDHAALMDFLMVGMHFSHLTDTEPNRDRGSDPLSYQSRLHGGVISLMG